MSERSLLELVRAAFNMARESGKLDWWRMTIAVLKNRLLLLTRKKFREEDYGTGRLLELLKTLPELSIDDTVFPPTVELGEAAPGDGARADVTSRPAARGIRRDLWFAVLDYSSTKKYLWNGERGLAEAVDAVPPGARLLPTITAADLAEWRKAFSQDNRDVTAEELVRLDTWAQRGLPTNSLPRGLVGRWNQALRKHVEERLRQWFSAQRLDVPADLLGASPTTKRREPDALRRLILDCVGVMTPEELSEIRLPPAAILRIKAGRPRG